jgi:hypothetical protein
MTVVELLTCYSRFANQNQLLGVTVLPLPPLTRELLSVSHSIESSSVHAATIESYGRNDVVVALRSTANGADTSTATASS